MPLRPLIAAIALGLVGCLPEPARPSPRFDAGPPINFDVAPEDATSNDQPAADRPSAVDRAADLGAITDGPTDRPTATTDGPDPTRSYPRGPYGVAVGTVIAPFQLPDCAAGTYRFDGLDWVPARATVVEFTTGYCAGCAALSRSIQGEVAVPYAAEGVRVVGVLIDGSVPGDPPTPMFCQQWVREAGVAHPMALDLGSTLRAHTDRVPLPQWVLTDSDGRIRWRSTGSTMALAELRMQLDRLLAGIP